MPDWESRYAAPDEAATRPARVLEEFAHLLPQQGRALDLACGLGANARLLARRGLTVQAWDSAEAAIARLQARAERDGLAVQAMRRDVLAQPPAPESFEVIVVSHFLARGLAPALSAALRPGGLLFYQTFVREPVRPAHGPRRAQYRLETGELLRLFPSLRLIVYREEGRLGDLEAGFRDEAYAIFERTREGR